MFLADGIGLFGAGDPVEHNRNIRKRFQGGRPRPEHNCGQRRVQLVRHHRLRDPGGARGRDTSHQALARVLRDRLVEHIRLHMALPHHSRVLARLRGRVGGRAHIHVLSHHRLVGVCGRHENIFWQLFGEENQGWQGAQGRGAWPRAERARERRGQADRLANGRVHNQS